MHTQNNLKGQIPEWPNGADCKSAGLRLRWFESIFAHKKNIGALVQPVRMPACHAGGHGFESRTHRFKYSENSIRDF